MLQPARDDDGRPFSDDVIFGNLMTMLVGGEDTTAYALGWVIHQLCDSPESVMELRQEADEFLGTSEVAGDVETANKLAWAGAVANETMRLRPITPVVVILEAKVETVVGDLLVPKGTRVVVLMRPAACHPDHFVEPHAFRPRRWLGANAGAHDVSAHIPFGSGPRICPGRILAILEMKLLLSMLYKTFDVERVGSAEAMREHFAITMAPVGLKVRLRRRSRCLGRRGNRPESPSGTRRLLAQRGTLVRLASCCEHTASGRAQIGQFRRCSDDGFLGRCCRKTIFSAASQNFESCTLEDRKKIWGECGS